MAKKTNSYFFIFVLVIFTFHLINNIVIVKQDNIPLFFDEGGFYNLSVAYYRNLIFSPTISRFFQHFYSTSQFYPPLVFIERIPFFAIWGMSQDVSTLANSLFLFILICFVFLIGKYIGGAKTGLLAAFLVSFYPGVYGFSRTNFLTIPMAASVAMSFYFLLRTEAFINRKFSILFGISIGIGLLVKWLYLIYILPAIFVCVFESFSRRKENNFGRASINFLIAMVVGIAIILPWYLPNIRNLIPMLFNASYDNPNWEYFRMFVLRNPFRIGLFKQMLMMEQYQLYTFYSILFLYFIFRYIIFHRGTIKWIFLASLFVPYLIFALAIIEYYSGELCPRYIIPLFNIIAVITAKGITEIKKEITRKIIIISVVLIGVSQFYWTWIFYSKSEGPYFTKETFQKRTTRGLLSPKTADWKIDKIINTIRGNRISNKTNILIIPHTPLTSILTYKLELTKESSLMFPLNATFLGGQYQAVPIEEYRGALDKADFVLTQEGGELSYDDSKWIIDNMDVLVKQFEEQKYNFSLLKAFDIDGGQIRFLIYRRSNRAVNSGTLPEPQGEGILIHAVDFYEGNLVYNSEFGLLIDGGVSPAYVIYEVTLPYDGKYELWVKYATQQFRPVDIYFDGTLRKSKALTKFTQGWKYSDSRWFKELEIDAEKDKHSLKFLAQETPFPHIDSIKIIYKTK